MEQEMATHRVWTKVVGAAALGAAAMYVFDPEKGRRRRAFARDKLRSMADDTADLMDAAMRDFSCRLQGLQAQARRFVRRDQQADDDVMQARVRAKLGRLTSHPHSIEAAAREGCITLRGPILRSEEEALLEGVRSVPGVREIENHLQAYDEPGQIPGLQGGSGRPRVRIEPLQENWTPALRLGAIAGGGIAGLYGLRQGGLTGVLLATAGVAIAARGATNIPMQRLAGASGGRQVFNLQKSIRIGASPEAVFDLWSNCENFPHFMSHVKEVRDLGGGRSHWVVTGPAGSEMEWDAVTTQSLRPRLLAWRTEPGSLVKHAGYVYFEPTEEGTRVTVKMAYNLVGALGHGVATLFRENPKQQLDDDLMRMKMFIETRVPPRDAAQPEATQGQVFH